MTVDHAWVPAERWTRAAETMAEGHLSLVALWGEPGIVHMALSDVGDAATMRIMSLSTPDGCYPSVGAFHAPAIRLERAAADLFGLMPQGLPDRRPWLKHSDAPYEFLPVEGDNLHQVPVGPVHAGIIEPGHFRFTADGETIVRLEARLGYAHKAVEALLRDAPLDRAARLAGRVSGDSTVAYALGFAQAVEVALGVSVPPRALWLRALMAEMERLANHLGDVGAICNDAAFSIMLAHCSVLRELILREAAASFGHRLMMDRIIPGGVAADLDSAGRDRIAALMPELRRRFRPLVALYEKTASILDRTVGTGILTAELAASFAAGGFIGRASGRNQDARRPGYAPYGELDFEVPVLSQGDVHARLWIRVLEIEQSLRLIEQITMRLPGGAVRAELPAREQPSEGSALVEGFRGDIFVWLSLKADGRIGRCHLRDPSWFQWPLLEAAIENNIIADFPLCNKSFNCSYSGVDL
ncbi:MAG TPA: hydrogenase expression protein HypE [Acidisoma sp.]|jgi:Ni,Fe-hydrogenase III large subunit|nr:hydrogenase expression protein HypE [Acidisoma sp.]